MKKNTLKKYGSQKKFLGCIKMKCRFCNAELKNTFLDLGKSPLANSYLKKDDMNKKEIFYPLRVFVCSKCFLVQLDEFESPKNIFSEYAYFSSFSDSWLNHVEKFSQDIISKFNFSKNNKVIEIASNDGYLLQYFKKEGLKTIGIEPAKNIAKESRKKGIDTITEFFGTDLAKQMVKQEKKADILIAFNVLPHVPNLQDFIKGLKIILNKNGIIVIQFSAYLLQLIKNNEFDTIYHEHFSYFSLFTLSKIFRKFNLEIFDVEEQSIHGGSLRIFIKHAKNKKYPINKNVKIKIDEEIKFGINKLKLYNEFQNSVINTKKKIWKFLSNKNLENKNIVAYGAPAKGNTMLNYCGIGKDIINYTVDRNPYKQNLFLPGSHIEICNIKKIFKMKPDYIIILPWNLKKEIIEQMNEVRKWGCKFVVFIPEVKIIS
jgi:SAM-dependent methyltransferase